MTKVIDTYSSFRSPYSYLATPDLLKIRNDFDVDIELRVVLPVALRPKEILFDTRKSDGFLILNIASLS